MKQFTVIDKTDNEVVYSGPDENHARKLYDFLILKMSHEASMSMIYQDSSVPELKD